MSPNENIPAIAMDFFRSRNATAKNAGTRTKPQGEVNEMIPARNADLRRQPAHFINWHFKTCQVVRVHRHLDGDQLPAVNANVAPVFDDPAHDCSATDSQADTVSHAQAGHLPLNGYPLSHVN
jgi:hypothetical protein